MSALLTIFNGFILTVVPLWLVFQTGGLHSPIFFLLYILLFGLALMFSPFVTLSLSLSLSILFYGQTQSVNDFLLIVSLLIITPTALFFGQQYLKLLENEAKIKILSVKKKDLQKEVTQQEQDTLLWLSLSFKESLTQILDTTSNLLADVSKLTQNQKEALNKIHQNARKLLQLGDKLKEQIED